MGDKKYIENLLEKLGSGIVTNAEVEIEKYYDEPSATEQILTGFCVVVTTNFLNPKYRRHISIAEAYLEWLIESIDDGIITNTGIETKEIYKNICISHNGSMVSKPTLVGTKEKLEFSFCNQDISDDKVPTDEEAAMHLEKIQLQEYLVHGCNDDGHIKEDEFLCKLLKMLGFTKTVDRYMKRDEYRWYS